MSDLQLWMIVLGVIIVGGVFAYNKLQEAKVRRRTERAFNQGHADVLLDGASQPATTGRELPEPAAPSMADPLDTDPPVAAPHPASRQAAEAVSARVEHTLGLNPTDALPIGPGPILDPRLDYVAIMVFNDPTPGESILRHAAAVLDGMPKAVAWEGFSDEAGRWVGLSPRDKYSAVRPAMQLVDRRGRVTESDLNLFCARLQELAATLAGELHLPSRAESLRAAEKLDVFCNDVDIQIGLNIVRAGGGTWPGMRVRHLAESAGCVLDRDGRFRRPAANGAEAYTIANLDAAPFAPETMATMATHGLTVLLDVPRAPGTEEAFAAFREAATRLAQTLDGRLVDDNRQPISPASLQSIASEVDAVRNRMRAEGLEPGGALALRLFA
jgi:hypothetical protein